MKIQQEECLTCEGTLRYYNKTRLNDSKNTYVCLECYHTISQELRKGCFDSDEAIKTSDFLREYKELKRKYCLLLKKLSILNKYSIITTISKFIGLEHKLSIKLYNKYRSTITKEEHIHILLYLIKYTLDSKEIKDMVISNNNNLSILNNSFNIKYNELTTI